MRWIESGRENVLAARARLAGERVVLRVDRKLHVLCLPELRHDLELRVVARDVALDREVPLSALLGREHHRRLRIDEDDLVSRTRSLVDERTVGGIRGATRESRERES